MVLRREDREEGDGREGEGEGRIGEERGRCIESLCLCMIKILGI
jgi:hypothetical protein